MDNKNKRVPDYTALPAEILRLIMSHVAQLRGFEKSHKKTISSDLFKCRLVSKTISMAASSLFESLVNSGRCQEYQTLHLPPRSGDLEALLTGLTGAHTMYANMITSIVYHITTGQTNNVEEHEHVYEYFCNSEYHYGEDSEGMSDSEGAGHNCCQTTTRNISTYSHQCRIQDKFASLVSKDPKRLATLLTSLPDLTRLTVCIKEFWDKAPTLFYGSPSERHAPAYTTYQAVLPALLRAVSASGVSRLAFESFGSYAFGGLDPINVYELNRNQTFLRNIRVLELQMSDRDNIRYDECGPDSGPLERADRTSFLLFQLKNLQVLTLSFDNEVHYTAGHSYRTHENMGSEEWLEDVLHQQSWSSLRSFSLKGFRYSPDNKTIPSFLKRHKAWLREIFMDNSCSQYHESPVLALVKLLHDDMALTKASIIIHKEHDLTPELMTMLETNRVLSQTLATPSLRVDIGALALKPQPLKVIEGE